MRPGRRTLPTIVLGITVLWVSCQQKGTTIQHVRSLAEIPTPRPELYEHIQDYAGWKNPYLKVLHDGIAIQCFATGFTKKVPVGALHQTLLSLPRSAWPYGRIVAVQAGGGPTTQDASTRIEQNRVQADAILKAVGVTVEYWPGA